MFRKLKAIGAAMGIVVGVLGEAQAQAAPPAGTYDCVTAMLMLANQVQYQPFSYTANNLGFEIGLGPVLTYVPSPLGTFTLDGKGKYTHLSLEDKPYAGGTYSVDQAGKVKFAGSLADTSNHKFSGYQVSKDGPVFAFDLPDLPTECFLRKGEGKTTGATANQPNTAATPAGQTAPRPKATVPNPNVNGVLTVSVGGEVEDIDARTGKTIWSSQGDGLQRLPGGLMAYALSNQLVIAKDQGQVLTRINGLSWKTGFAEEGAFLSLSPDGTRLLVAPLPTEGSFSPPRWRLMAPDGRELAQLPDAEASHYITLPRDVPAFLPDGTYLIPNPEDKLLYVYDTNLRKKGLFVQEPSNTPVVSPDGKQVAMLRGNQIVLTDTSGRELKRLPVPGDYQITAMAFSPDSRLLGLLYSRGSGYGRYLGYVDPAAGSFELLKDADGEPVFRQVSFLQGYRLSWWTGQSALPPAWKSGVPAAVTNAAPGAPAGRAGTPVTEPVNAKPTSVTPTAVATAPAGPWPTWLPKAKFKIGDVSGVLDLRQPTQEGGGQGLVGTALVNGTTITAGLLVQNGLKMVALQQQDGSVLACLLTEEGKNEASGLLFKAPNSEAMPMPTGGTCSLTGQ